MGSDGITCQLIVKFPGDKSISHRALMLASLTNGECSINNLSTGEDVESTRKCLEDCGIHSTKNGNSVQITSGTLQNSEKHLNAGNSGTTVRLMMGLLAGQHISAGFTGDTSLSSRPMGRIIIPLSSMGANITSTEGFLPIQVISNHLSGIDYTQKISSAQVKSAILFAGLGADGTTIVREKVKSRDHTELMLKALGANINIENENCSVTKLENPIEPFELTVPGDPSTAAFFAAASALIPGKEIILENILANPTRTGFYDILEKMGAGMECLSREEKSGELVGKLKITQKPLQAINIGKNKIPTVIDELPILAILATQAEGITTVTGAEELRVKETDRIHAICFNLKKMGAEIEEFDDGFSVTGPTKLRGTEITTFGDHRIAMAFTIAGLISNGEVQLDNSDCVKISCPEFFKLLKEFV